MLGPYSVSIGTSILNQELPQSSLIVHAQDVSAIQLADIFGLPLEIA